MTLSSRSRLSFLSLTLRGAGGIPLLLLCACTVGIDDRPVPPEAIPNVAYQQDSQATYRAPAESAAPIIRAAAPTYSGQSVQSGGAETLVWRTGAQPVAIERTSLAPPEAASSEAENAPAEESEPAENGDASATLAQTEASEQPAPAEEPAPEQAAAVQPAQAHSFRLAPFVGLDADAAGPLREAMQAEAERQGIDLSGGPEKLVLKGYLSSMEDGGSKVLTYVWDVYDTSGNRLTRIDGQQKLPRDAQTEPLQVDAATSRKLAEKIMATLSRWQPDEAG